jgi:hypothetical protein
MDVMLSKIMNFLPFICLCSPMMILTLVLIYRPKEEDLKTSEKLLLGFIAMIGAVIMSFVAFHIFAIQLSSSGVKCVTGAIFFIPLGIVINLIGVPLILLQNKSLGSRDI